MVQLTDQNWIAGDEHRLECLHESISNMNNMTERQIETLTDKTREILFLLEGKECLRRLTEDDYPTEDNGEECVNEIPLPGSGLCYLGQGNQDWALPTETQPVTPKSPPPPFDTIQAAELAGVTKEELHKLEVIHGLRKFITSDEDHVVTKKMMDEMVGEPLPTRHEVVFDPKQMQTGFDRYQSPDKPYNSFFETSEGDSKNRDYEEAMKVLKNE